ncbi:basic proline-rich protein-like [Choloepus didactylus]|uniref:basic proline-rich protein-like n=1 Tax=Choloepus didactylus TaxID=27675 RepID=UPI00189E0366|nr:basic proline-rich protein-like [Choloepus didactylus]
MASSADGHGLPTPGLLVLVSEHDRYLVQRMGEALILALEASALLSSSRPTVLGEHRGALQSALSANQCHRRGIRPPMLPPSSSSRRPAGPLLPARALPPSSSPPRATASSPPPPPPPPFLSRSVSPGPESIPAREPERPGRRLSDPLAVRRSALACVRPPVRPPACPGECPVSPQASGPGRRGMSAPWDHPGVGSPGRGAPAHPPSPPASPQARPRYPSARRAHGDVPGAAFCYDAAGGRGPGGGRRGPGRAGIPFDSPSPRQPSREAGEWGLSLPARSRPNLKSEPGGAASGPAAPAWSPPTPGWEVRWGAGGAGAGGVTGEGVPGPGCREPGPPGPRGASGQAWRRWPGRGWARPGLVPAAHSPQPPASPLGRPSSPLAQKLAKVLGACCLTGLPVCLG